MNKTVKMILQAISYVITLLLGAAGGTMVCKKGKKVNIKTSKPWKTRKALKSLSTPARCCSS